jgi:hypothetical protein
MQKSEVTEIMDIGLLDCGNAEFYVSGNGFVGLRYMGKDYKRVVLSRTLPFKKPDEYISIADTENKEIGILRSINELSDGQAGILRKELEKRYYCPSVIEILSVKEKMGYVYFDVRIKGGTKTFAVKDVSRNVRQLDDRRIIIFDVDGNRYMVEEISALDAKSLRRIEPYLF